MGKYNVSDEFKYLLSNKINSIQRRIYLCGLCTVIIQDKSFFSPNIKLKEFTRLIENNLNLEPYKDYLYDSRTVLASRVSKDLLHADDISILKTTSELNKNFEVGKSNADKVDSKKTNMFDLWMESLKNDR